MDRSRAMQNTNPAYATYCKRVAIARPAAVKRHDPYQGKVWAKYRVANNYSTRLQLVCENVNRYQRLGRIHYYESPS